jgi:hypothetical protein
VLDTDGNEVEPYLDLTDFTVNDVALMHNGNVSLAGKWAAPGTGYAAYAILDPKLDYVKAITNINTEVNANTAQHNVTTLPSNHVVFSWYDGKFSYGRYAIFDELGTLESTGGTYGNQFYTGSINYLSVRLNSKGDVVFSWINTSGEGWRRILQSKGVRFNKDFLAQVEGASGGLDIDDEIAEMGNPTGVRLIVDWDDSQLIEMRDRNNQRIFRGSEWSVDTGRSGINQTRLVHENNTEHYYRHQFWGQSLSQLLTLIYMDGVNERMDIGDPAHGMYLRYVFESDLDFRFMSGASDVWMWMTTWRQQLGNNSNGYLRVSPNNYVMANHPDHGTVMYLHEDYFQWGAGSFQLRMQVDTGDSYLVMGTDNWRVFDAVDRDIDMGGRLEVKNGIHGVQQAGDLRAHHELPGQSKFDNWDSSPRGSMPQTRVALVKYRDALYCIGGQDGGTSTTYNTVYKSEDGGYTWTLLTSSAFHTTVGNGWKNMNVVVHNDKMIAFGGSDSGGNGFGRAYESTDGATWTQIDTVSLMPDRAAVFSFKGFIWAIGDNQSPSNHIFRSRDGANWTQISNGFPGRQLDMKPVVHGGAVYLIGGYDFSLASKVAYVWKSTDGINWTNLGSVLPAATTTGFALKYKGKIFYFAGGSHWSDVPGTKDAIWSSDDGVNWTVESETLPELYGGYNNSAVVYKGRVIYGWGYSTNFSTISANLYHSYAYIRNLDVDNLLVGGSPLATPADPNVKEARLGQAFANVAVGAGALNQRGIIVSGDLPLFYEYQGAGNQPSPQISQQEQAGIEFSPGAGNIGIVTPAMYGGLSGGSLRANSENCIVTSSPPNNEAYFTGLIRMDIPSENHIFGYHPTNSSNLGPIPWSLTPTEFVGFQSISGAIWILVKDGTQTISYNTGLTFSNGDDYKVVIDSSLNPTFFRNSAQIIPPGVSAISGRSYLVPAFQAGRTSGNFWIVTQMSSKRD